MEEINDRYRAVRLLGTGGSGRVFECVDTLLKRRVAVKLQSVQDDDSEIRFLREAQAAARLSHPGVAGLYDVGRTAVGQVFVVQELVDGTSLGHLISVWPQGLRPNLAVHLLLQIADALAYAHANGIVHRDVKPSNVMVMETGVTKLLDFGIARVHNLLGNTPIPNITAAGAIVGTPQYMSPEQMRGDVVTASTDIYAFGALAYELLSGKKPHGEGSFVTVLMRVMEEEPQALSDRVNSLPPVLEELVLTCLAKVPVDRPSTMAAVVETLQQLTHGWDPIVLGRALSHSPDLSSPGTSALVIDPPTLERTAAVPNPSKPTATWRNAQVGQRLGRFVLHELVSPGKSGDLYKAYDEVRGTLVGVRVLRARDQGARERLLRGGRIWIKLQHPHIVHVYEVHPDFEGYPGIIVTQLVDGLNIDQLVAQRPPSLEQAVWIAMQTCDALAAIHAMQVVHREVKPRNIIVSGPGMHVTLLDSGIARHENPEVDAFTKTGVFVGDLAYAAPEMAQGIADQRSDIYGVAAVLYELVTRTKLPFPLPQDWQPAIELNKRLPSRLVNVLARGLQRDPQLRFGSVGELHDQLRPLAASRTETQIRPAVVALHGIRTQAAWQRAFLEVAARHGLDPHVDRWNFGYFSVVRFLVPWARLAKVRWFREAFQQEFREAGNSGPMLPSIVAHSFGTYILGNALLRYPYLRFDKVLLCGSILPRAFPWDLLLERGQVQAVRNEYGRHDVWTRAVGWFVPGTGPSGLEGFSAQHLRMEQEVFSFEHSEYFERGHMEQRWMPFLMAQVAQHPPQDITVPATPPAQRPWGLYAVYTGLLVAAFFGVGLLVR